MKINEVAETEELPHLYLDMDGVQADFFGEWVRLSGVDHWRALHDREEEIEKLAHSSAQEVKDFFARLHPLPGGMKLVSWLKANDIPFTILSAPLRGPYHNASVEGKREWLDQHNPGTRATAIFTGEKQIYAMSRGKKNVLVDDYGKNLRKWEAAGGIAIRYEDEYDHPDAYLQVIEALTTIYKR